jgi:hypothetical protein
MLLEASFKLLEASFKLLEVSFTAVAVQASVATIVNYNRRALVVKTTKLSYC